MMLIKSTLMVLLVAISIAVISAANPFDTVTKPFAVGGSFKRLERKSTANFACYNTTLGDWSEQRWMDFQTTDAFSSKFVQLKNSHIIALVSVGGSKFGLRYYNLESSTLLTTTATVLEGTFNDMLLSYDQKKLYILGTFTRVGTSVYTLTQIVPRLLSFDISTLPTLAAPTDVSSNYNILTPAFTSGFTFRAVSNNNQLVAFTGVGTEMVVYDPSTTSWKKVTPTSYSVAGADIRISSSTGELYIKASEQTASPYATSFYKYDGNDVVIVKTLPSSSLIASAIAGQNYVTKWTVGGNAIYYAVTPSIATTTDFENGMQNIQKVDLLPSPSAPVSLGKTRITTTLTRGSTSGFDYAPISAFISSMYYDENVKKLIVTLNGEGYQIYGTRESDVAKQNYELTYRVQPIGNMIAYDATAETYTVPYGGAFVNIPNTFSHYAGSGVTCFSSGSAFDYYRTWSPYFAVYDESKDMFVADDKYVSNNIDYDFINGKVPSVSAVENSADDSTVYIGGYFRTISGTVYNSIVARTKTGLVTLGTGLRSFSLDYNYLDIVPGSVKKIVRSKDNRYLFVLGTFNRAGDLWVNNLAYWNIEKKTWNKLETTNMDAVLDIDYDGKYLYAVGSMTKAGRYIVKNVARFEVETGVWTPMNDGLSSTVSRGIVIDGKFIAFSPAGSGVSFTKSLAVWSSNAWKAVEMQAVSNSGCSTKEYCMNDGWSAVAIAYYKGKIYFMDSTKVYVADSSLSKVTTYLEGSLEVTSDTSFYNYPKKNTIAVATINSNKFIEYNIDTKNIQHTITRDGNVLADGNVAVLSAAPKNAFAAVAMIIALVIALLF